MTNTTTKKPVRHPSLPPRSHPDYKKLYYRQVQVPAKKAERPAKKAAKRESLKEKRNTRLNVAPGFDACVASRTNRKEQARLVGRFFRWQKIYTVGDTLTDSTDDEDSSHMHFALQLNVRYAKKADPLWIDWLIVKQSTLDMDEERPYGLFADRLFHPGDTIGVYMGARTNNSSTKKGKHHYVMEGVADAKGGVNSGQPALLGMHFINDPNYYVTSDNIEAMNMASYNAQVSSDGVVTARHAIPRGREIFVDYRAVKTPTL